MTKSRRGERIDVLPPDFMDFVIVLHEHGVECVLVGGYAVAVHGVVRATGDIDFFFRATSRNVRKLLAALEAFGAPPECLDEGALLTPQTVVAFGQEPLRIDLLNAIDGVTFDQVWVGALPVDIQGRPLRVIGLEELIANKRASGRTKDLQDARKLARQLSAVDRAAPSSTDVAATSRSRARSARNTPERAAREATEKEASKGAASRKGAPKKAARRPPRP